MNEILDAINRIADNMDGESSSSVSSNIFDVVFTLTLPENDVPTSENVTVTCDKTVAEIKNATDSGKKINATLVLEQLFQNMTATRYIDAISYFVLHITDNMPVVYCSHFTFHTEDNIGDLMINLVIYLDANNDPYISVGDRNFCVLTRDK